MDLKCLVLYNKKRSLSMGDIDYSRIRDILVLRPCVVGFALRNLRDIYFLQMELVVWSVLLSGVTPKFSVIVARL